MFEQSFILLIATSSMLNELHLRGIHNSAHIMFMIILNRKHQNLGDKLFLLLTWVHRALIIIARFQTRFSLLPKGSLVQRHSKCLLFSLPLFLLVTQSLQEKIFRYCVMLILYVNIKIHVENVSSKITTKLLKEQN